MQYIRLYALLLLLAGSVGRAADDLESLVGLCEACHGPNGVSADGAVPIIAGQPEGMIRKTLKQFQDMDRPCQRRAFLHGGEERPATTMCEIADGLSGIDIDAVASHFAAQPFEPADQEFDADIAITGATLHGLYCESCHPRGGSQSGYAARLAGQWRPYLERTIGEIASGELIVPHMMERKLSEFSAEEIDSLLHFWASQQD